MKFAKMKQMHPRNIYNTRVDFNALAKSYPEFKEHVKLDLSGKVTLDFKDPEALRALSKVLLKRDFNLDIDIPINTLIPTIPLRLNYILFIEDLLNCANITSNVIGIDIGTGASCIYPLMAARKNNWKMVGSDCHLINLRYAMNNVSKNKLNGQVQVIQVSGETAIKELLNKDKVEYAFCMCNPPFYSDTRELSCELKSRKPNRKKPNNAFTARAHEVLTEGGEVEFIKKIINESKEYKDRIKIFTTMVGIKHSIKPITSTLLEIPDIKSYAQTTFFQGFTSRWGIAWTYQDNINLKEVSQSDIIHKKKKKPLMYSQPCEFTIDQMGIQLEEIFERLQIEFKILKKENSSRLYSIVAYFDTWSHDRQRRREQRRIAKIMEGLASATSEKMDTSSEDQPREQMEQNSPQKRKLSESEGDEEMDTTEEKKLHLPSTNVINLGKIVDATVYVHLDNNLFAIEIDTVSSETRRYRIHEILQYLKNQLRLKE